MSKRFLVDAGICDGMSVLEIGCGPGEVTELLSQLVGSRGRVVAVDVAPTLLDLARARLRDASNVTLVQADATGDLTALDVYGNFDALVGRRILMYVSSRVNLLKTLAATRLRDDAIVVFEESDATAVAAPQVGWPAHTEALGWLRQMLVAEGASLSMGSELPKTFVAAGLTVGGIRAEAIIQGQGTQFPLTDLIGLMRDRLVSKKIATSDEIVDVQARIVAERIADPLRVFISDMTFCAWARNAKMTLIQ